jgi:hypothetical protein
MITVQQEYKIVVTIGAGRKEYMELLLPQILREYDYVDEIRFCINTTDEENLKWLYEQAEKYDKITLDERLIHLPLPEREFEGKSHNPLLLNKFWEGFKDHSTIYVRLDDDVIYIEEGFIEKMVNFRIKNLEYLFVLPNIINNSICDHIHQRIRALNIAENIAYDCVNINGVENGEVAVKKHKNFLDKLSNNTLDDYRFPEWVLAEYERISINSLCWFGRDLAGVELDWNEEIAVSSDIPRRLNRPNIIYGDVLIVHYAFHTQRDYLQTTDILDSYKEILTSLVK